MQKYIKINENDNVVVALLDLPCGMEICFGETRVVLIENIAQGHKFSLVEKTLISGNAEDVVSFSHPYGCSQMGDDQDHTRT